ncbi:hypothetical protein V6N13_148378 [Hibiscus sabdariffa]
MECLRNLLHLRWNMMWVGWGWKKMKVINGSAADDVGLDVDKPNAGVENVRGKGVTQVPMKVMVVDVQEVSDGLASKEIPLKPSFRDMVTGKVGMGQCKELK